MNVNDLGGKTSVVLMIKSGQTELIFMVRIHSCIYMRNIKSMCATTVTVSLLEANTAEIIKLKCSTCGGVTALLSRPLALKTNYLNFQVMLLFVTFHVV